MRIGLLGGTFNPIHCGHLHIAEAVWRSCNLDRVWFVPTATPPHKELVGAISFDHRLAMVSAAITPYPQFRSCGIEGKRGGISYSVETLKQLHNTYPQHEFYFIMGFDSFLEIATWKNYQQLFKLAHIVVTARPGFSGSLQQSLPVAIADRFCYDSDSKNLIFNNGFSLISVADTNHDISSTELRQQLASPLDLNEHIPTAVIDYIRANQLYL